MKSNSLMILLALALVWACTHANAATPQPVQFCPIADNKFAVPSGASDSLRTLNPATNTQACLPYSALTSAIKVRGGNPVDWHYAGELNVPFYTASTTPPVTPPVTPPPACPNTFVNMTWKCTSNSDGTSTCTGTPVTQ